MRYTFLIIYMLVISLIAVILTVHDKKSAKRGRWRTRESTLLLVSAMGGSVAMFVTMRIIHHKTRHLKFMLGIPLIFVLQIALAALLVFKYGI